MEAAIACWMDALTGKIRAAFEERVLFIGLQGSHRRGEAGPESDVDVVLVLDRLEFTDLKRYRELVAEMPDSKRACGFVSGRDVISQWPKHELVQFYYDTDPVYGSLESLLPSWDRDDIVTSVRMGAGTIYHSVCHQYLYGEGGPEALQNDYKMAFFTLRVLYLLEHRRYLITKEELLGQLWGLAKEILETNLNWDSLEEDRRQHPDKYYQNLLDWCTDVLESL